MLDRLLAPCAVVAMAVSAQAQTTVPFAYAWSFQGPTAPYFVAEENGYFKEAGINLDMHRGTGSVENVARVASGAYPLGFADINALVTFLDRNPDAPVTGVMMFFDRPAYAVIGRKSLGVTDPSDLEGITLGAPPGDAAWAQFPAFALANDIDLDKINVEPVGFPIREVMLAEGKVDAVTGFSTSSYFNLLGLGVPAEDISVMHMSDHGLELYGNAIIVNTDFAQANPEIVRGFLDALAQGVKDTIQDPVAAIETVQRHSPALDPDLELERLQMMLTSFVLTDFTRENGFGTIDPERFAQAIEQLRTNQDFASDPNLAAYFTDAYLPEGGFALK
ncbi:MAG: ABC transporter substrate-binding protein [Pseudomonadota bacterium]